MYVGYVMYELKTTLHAPRGSTRSFAKTMAAPNRLGIVKAGSTAAKSVAAAMAAAGIGLGIYDIIGGSEELKGANGEGNWVI